MNDDAARVPAWWETLTFTHGPETEWFARSVFREACRAGKTIYWRCAPTRRSVDALDRLLVTADFRLVLEHRDEPTTPRGKELLHRVYVRAEGDGVALVNREGTLITFSVAAFDRTLAERIVEPAQRTEHRHGRRRFIS